MEEKNEKKTITLSLGTGVALIVILIISILILSGVYFYEIQKVKRENLKPETNAAIPSENTNSEKNVVVEENSNHKNNDKVKDSYKEFNLGKYINKIKNEDGKEEEINIEFEENNKFRAFNGWGTGYFGAYRVSEDGNSIICSITARWIEQYNPSFLRATGKFEFKILNESTIEIVNEGTVNDNVEDTKDKLFFAKGDRFIIEKIDKKISLNEKKFKVGNYLDKAQVTEEYEDDDKIFEFYEDNTFTATFGEAGVLTGSYRIDENIIICEAISVESEQLYPHNFVEAKGKTTFKIVDENTIEIEEAENIVYGGDNAPKEGKTFYNKGEKFMYNT